MSDSALLSVQDLCVGIPGKTSSRVEHVTFRLNEGEILGITGKSGSGKTLTAMALAGILPPQLKVYGGCARFMGRLFLPGKAAQTTLNPGRDILMLFQSPSRALDPWVRIGVQLVDAIKAAGKRAGENPRKAAMHALEKAGFDGTIYHRYPFELSGGQRQRSLMALALAIKPRILIADEPATGQDDIHKTLIIQSIRNLTENKKTAIIVISHDLRVLQGLAQDLVVIYRGRQIESGPAPDLLHNPVHPHTRDLVEAMAFLEGGDR